MDSDLYKFTMQWAVLCLFPWVKVHYQYINRRPEGKFTPSFLIEFRRQVLQMSNLSLSKDEMDFMARRCPFLPPQYLAYLLNYRFNPNEVTAEINEAGELVVDVYGYWHSAILWETPLMEIISEIYFALIDTDWIDDENAQRERANRKLSLLDANDCQTAEFGARRRRSYRSQYIFMEEAVKYRNIIGTSNVHLAHTFNMKPIGTMAHEFYQAMSVLMGLRHANRFALDLWVSVYKANLGIALTDTYGLDAFFGDFTLSHAKMWDGLRWDSGNPYAFTDRSVGHYRGLSIDPMSKWGIYTNGLDDETAVQIRRYTEGKIKASFGIGTFFSNDFRKRSAPTEVSKALNIVIKLCDVEDNGRMVPVVKLGEDTTKLSGDPGAIKVAQWTFFGNPI